ncbi:hypothetical protein HBB16_09365 [Pseudonocardia sp. MCCB 268]|nr:hypothetical protein [Pseudonocardia cytotoxica]
MDDQDSGAGSGSARRGQGGTRSGGAGQGGAGLVLGRGWSSDWSRPDRRGGAPAVVTRMVDDFENGLEGWNAYDGPTRGPGRRSPEAASVQDGILTINGSRTGRLPGWLRTATW